MDALTVWAMELYLNKVLLSDGFNKRINIWPQNQDSVMINAHKEVDWSM